MNIVDFTPSPFDREDPRFSGAVSGADHIPGSDQRLHAFLVSFDPGSRTAWHSHIRGQLLICTAGRGAVGTRDGTVLLLEPGVAVWTEPGEQHWHGAATDSTMTHVAVQTREPGEDEVAWLERVPGQQTGKGKHH